MICNRNKTNIIKINQVYLKSPTDKTVYIVIIYLEPDISDHIMFILSIKQMKNNRFVTLSLIYSFQLPVTLYQVLDIL